MTKMPDSDFGTMTEDKNPDSGFRVLALTSTSACEAQLKEVLSTRKDVKFNIVNGKLSDAESTFKDNGAAPMFIWEIKPDQEADIEELRKFVGSVQGASTNVVVTAENLNHTTMLRLLRAGAADFLPQPISVSELTEVLNRVSRHVATQKADPAQNGHIYSFIHASGGTGATTLAVNSAVLLAEMNKDKKHSVCFIDLDLQFGGAEMQLDLTSHSPILETIESPERIDSEMLEAMMVRHPTGLHVLTAPKTPVPMEAIDSAYVERILRLARRRYEYVVVDLPQSLTSWTDTVLKMSSNIFAVAQMTVPAIRQMRRLFDALEQEGLYSLPIHVIINRYGGLRRFADDRVGLAQAEKALERKVDFTVPNDFRLISEALDQGRPAALLRPRSKFAQKIQNMMDTVSTQEGAKSPRSEKGKKVIRPDIRRP